MADRARVWDVLLRSWTSPSLQTTAALVKVLPAPSPGRTLLEEGFCLAQQVASGEQAGTQQRTRTPQVELQAGNAL